MKHRVADGAAARIRLLALDVDGTLLDPAGRLSLRTIAAVARARNAGVHVILCTGRRYRRARPVALELGLEEPLVCNSGALIKDPTDHRTLSRAEFPGELARRIIGFLRDRGEPIVSFTDGGFAGPDFHAVEGRSAAPHFEEYVAANREHARRYPAGADLAIASGAFHICAIGERDEMAALEAEVHHQFTGMVQTFVQRSPRYSGTMCEILDRSAGKWSAVLSLAAERGISAKEICAVGDDRNDMAMIAGAGIGVAMEHAPEDIRAAADWTAQGNGDDGAALVIERILERE